MTEESEIQLFEGQQIRYVWDREREKYFFSVVDVIQVLTDSPRPRKYWNALKTKLIAEGSEVSQNMGQLKMTAPDGKQRLTSPSRLRNCRLRKRNEKESNNLTIAIIKSNE